MYVQKSYVLKPQEAEKKWFLIDAKDKIVGNIAVEAANILRGKNSPKFTPNTDSGDFVVIVNADKVKFSGKKWEQKEYIWHTNHIGGLKTRTAREQLEKHPELILLNAVKGMLPKNSLGRKQLTKCKVYVGPEHPHEAQKLEVYNIVK